MVDDGQIVADQHVGDAELGLQILHQVEHLGLYRYIERADRFIGHDQPGFGDEGARNGNALALAARKLMRVLVRILRAQAYLLQHLDGAVALLGTAAVALSLQWLADDAFHRLARVQRSIRVLKHHLEILARAAQSVGWHAVQVLAMQQHLAGCRFVQRHHQARQGGFA